jgi:hypothetical protein
VELKAHYQVEILNRFGSLGQLDDDDDDDVELNRAWGSNS